MNRKVIQINKYATNHWGLASECAKKGGGRRTSPKSDCFDCNEEGGGRTVRHELIQSLQRSGGSANVLWREVRMRQC